MIMENYEGHLQGPREMRVRNAHLAAITFGYSMSVRFAFIGANFYIGSIFISRYQLKT